MYETLVDAEARIVALHPIHGIGGSESPPEWIEELVEQCDIDALSELFPEIQPILSDPSISTKLVASEIADRWLLKGRSGYFVNAHVCVRRYVDDSTSWYSGWGHVRLHWFYIKDAADAVPRTIELATEQHLQSQAMAGHA